MSRDFQICISVPLRHQKDSQYVYLNWLYLDEETQSNLSYHSAHEYCSTLN